MEPLCEAHLAPGFCVGRLPIDISRPRSILSIGTSSLLALERGTNSVVLLTDNDGDDIADTKTVIVTAPGLNHGMEYDRDNGYLYASRDTTAWRWNFDGTNPATNMTEVIVNMNADGNGGAPQGHTTRTLKINGDTMYVSVGSFQNVDANSFRSRIRVFNLTEDLFPFDFMEGQVFMDGLRNTVDMTFDQYGVMWGVDMGADSLVRPELGRGIFNDNPGDELNRFDKPMGTHFGYPYCWTEFLLPENVAMGQGTPWAWPSFLNDGVVTDEDCRTSYEPPVRSLQAHSSPLGITFYKFTPPGERPAECPAAVAFPESMDGYMFMAFHGSWNRVIPTGYKVVYLEVDGSGNPVGEPVDLIYHRPPDAKWENGFRPVGVQFDDCGRLVVSSDGTFGSGAGITRIEFSETGSANCPVCEGDCRVEDLCGDGRYSIYRPSRLFLPCQTSCVRETFLELLGRFGWQCGSCPE